MGASSVEAAVQQVAWLLLGAALLGLLAWRIHVPYAVALVLGGLAIEESHLVAVPRLDPSVMLFVFLPPLLFDAAFRLDARELVAQARTVLLLAVPGTLATAGIVGLIVSAALGLPLPVGLLFGSLVAATDPVAIVGVFRTLQAPPRLAVIAEGESLINDGVALVLYTALVELAVTGTASAPASIGLFARETIGGVLIGGVLGIAFSRLTALLDDHLVEMTLSTALAYGSYLIAQSVETSGALACVAAGLIHGSYGRRIGMSDSTRRLLDDLWEFLGFTANALVFLLVGFSANVGDLIGEAGFVGATIGGVILARVIVVGILGAVPGRGGRVLPLAERAVLVWGGLRGALTITLALALPAAVPARELLIVLAFGMALFTLVVQALSLPVVLRRLGLVAARVA